jgi:hypothetical protein
MFFNKVIFVSLSSSYAYKVPFSMINSRPLPQPSPAIVIHDILEPAVV